MPPIARITVRVDKSIDGDSVYFGVPVRFRPVIEEVEKGTRRIDRSREMVTAIAPVSSFPNVNTLVNLSWGAYDVEAVLPSGEQLVEELSVGPEAEKYQGGQSVVLRGEYSPNEGRSWAHYTGALLASSRHTGLGFKKALVTDQAAQFEISIGHTAVSLSERSFSASSWNGWFNFFSDRFNFGFGLAPNNMLAGVSSGLEVRTEGGHNGTPYCIKFIQHVDPRSDLYNSVLDIGRWRTYAAIAGVTSTRLLALPLPWFGSRASAHNDTRFEILVFEAGDEMHMDPVLKDERWAGLVAYLNRGRVDLASEILKTAQDALFEKFENPLAAAIGGYVLLSSMGENDGERWPYWLDNLARRFPYLPDGPILRARWLLSRNSEESRSEVGKLLEESVRRGLPYFTTGVVWLIEGLEKVSIDNPNYTELLRIVRGVARMMDLRQAFTSFLIANPHTREVEGTNFGLLETPHTMLENPFVQATQSELERSLSETLLPHQHSIRLKLD